MMELMLVRLINHKKDHIVNHWMDKPAKLTMVSIVIYPLDMIVLQVTKLILLMSLNVIL